MNKIMQALDVFLLPGLGTIVSGTNSDFDSMTNQEIEEYIGERVIIVNSAGEEIEASIKGIDVSTSLIGKKNVMICLPCSVKPLDIEQNSSIYSASKGAGEQGAGEQVAPVASLP